MRTTYPAVPFSSSARRAAKVLIAHPERQHSHQLAVALHEAGLLGRYLHGAPIPTEVAAAIPTSLRARLRLFRLGRQLLRPMLPPPAMQHALYNLMWMFDRIVAKRLSASDCHAVVAYENSALETFRAAKRLGMTCILDNAGVHHTLQDRMLPLQEPARLHSKVVARKDEELAEADLILVCSTFAAESFVAGGVPPNKLRVVPPGCDTAGFSTVGQTRRRKGGPIRFLFVGRLTRPKGVDVLIEAVHRLRTDNVPFSLAIAGSVSEGDSRLVAELAPVARMLGKIDHADLPTIYAAADCIIVPSRFESFSFVVAEAMSSGLPVIVSDHVGAKDMIVDGANGWIIPHGDAIALASRMAWCAANPQVVSAMAAAARASAGTCTWTAYRRQIVATMATVLDDSTRRQPLHHCTATG